MFTESSLMHFQFHSSHRPHKS